MKMIYAIPHQPGGGGSPGAATAEMISLEELEAVWCSADRGTPKGVLSEVLLGAWADYVGALTAQPSFVRQRNRAMLCQLGRVILGVHEGRTYFLDRNGFHYVFAEEQQGARGTYTSYVDRACNMYELAQFALGQTEHDRIPPDPIMFVAFVIGEIDTQSKPAS